MSFDLRTTMASLESQDSVDTYEETGYGVDSMESALMNVNEVWYEYQAAEYNTGRIEEIQASLENQKFHAEKTLESQDDLSPQALKAVAIGVVASVQGSLESFGATLSESISQESLTGADENGKELLEVASMEASEWIDKLMDAIEKMIVNVRKWIKQLWHWLFDSSPKVKSKAEGLAKRVSKVKGKAKNDTINNSGVAQKLSIDGKVSNVSGGLNTLNNVVKEVTTDKLPAKLETIRAQAVANIDKPDEKLGDSIMGELKNWPLSNMKAASDKVLKSLGGGEKVEGFMSEELLGGVVLAASRPNQEADKISKRLSAIKAKLVPADKDKKATSFSTLDASEMGKICSTVSSMMDFIGKYKRDHEARDKARDKILKDAKTAKGKVGKDADQKVKDAANDLMAITKATINLGAEPVSSVCKHAISTSGAALQAVELSLKEYDGASKDGDDKGDKK